MDDIQTTSEHDAKAAPVSAAGVRLRLLAAVVALAAGVAALLVAILLVRSALG